MRGSVAASRKETLAKMDISKLSHGAKVVLGAGIVFLITSFFNWFEVTDAGL